MSQTPLPDDDRDYLQERADRLRYLDQERAHAETQEHPVIKSDEYSFWFCLGSLAMAALATLLLFLVVLHRVYLPDATVWPMGVAALICAGACAVTGWFGVRGLK